MGWLTQEECGLGAPMAFSEELAERIRQGLARRPSSGFRRFSEETP
jgi:hypothetical protein